MISFEARKIRLIMSLRSAGITDTAVLSAVERTPREDFVPEEFHDKVYDDMALPIGLGQTISQPFIVALMTQALDVNDRCKVLEIGTGSGYQALILSKLCRRVYTIERCRALLAIANKRFEKMGVHNITTIARDGMKGWPEQEPFDRIIVTAAAQGEIPPALLDQLAIGGIMVVPVFLPEDATQLLVKIVRTETGFETEELAPVRFVPLLPDVSSQPLEGDAANKDAC